MLPNVIRIMVKRFIAINGPQMLNPLFIKVQGLNLRPQAPYHQEEQFIFRLVAGIIKIASLIRAYFRAMNVTQCPFVHTQNSATECATVMASDIVSAMMRH